MSTFKSKIHPEMNPFLEKLEVILKKLPNNPKPDCTGFYLANYDLEDNIITVEEIGIVPPEKQAKYRYFAAKKLTETLYREEKRSLTFAEKDLEKERFPGGIVLLPPFYTGGSAISGHDSMIDEAGAYLWTVTRYYAKNATIADPMSTEAFWENVRKDAVLFNQECNDNEWVRIIAEQLR